MDAKILNDMDQRDICVTIQRDTNNIIAKLLGNGGGIVIIFIDQRSASQIECHLFIQQAQTALPQLVLIEP